MHRARVAILALTGLALAAGCGDTGPAGSPRIVVAPILDSLFVGDVLAARSARYFDARGDSQATGPVRWTSSDTAVLRVDSVTGGLLGRGRGSAVLSARANGIAGSAFLVVSRPLDVSLLLDTIILMQGDTFTVPYDIRVKGGGGARVWFRTPPNPYFVVDSANGRDSARVPGPARPFYVFAATATDTVADSGATEVVQLTDTTGGKGSFSVLGTVIRRARAGARAVNYRRQGDTATFRVSLPVVVGGIAVENIVITLRDSIRAPGVFPVDSISPGEVAGANFVCRPLRSWALWSIQTASSATLRGLSRRGGAITITQVIQVPHGFAVSGRFAFTGQRSDLYDDPLGALPVRGTFVAPLIADNRPCR
jgi:hypothetical protein